MRDEPLMEHALRRVAAACQAGDIASARTLVEQILQAHPREPRARFYLGEIMRHERDYAGAIACYRRVLDGGLRTATVYLSRGIAHRHLGQLEEALRCFERAAALDPGSAEAFGNLGNAYFSAGDHLRALSHYERALALEPNDGRLYGNVAAALLKADRLDDVWRLVSSGWPPQVPIPRDLLLTLALMLQAAARDADSRLPLAMILAADPDDVEALGAEGLARFRTGDFVGAARALGRVRDEMPSDPVACFHLGAAQRACDDTGAEDTLEAALALTDSQPDLANLHLRVRYELGLLRLARGDFERGWAGFDGRWFTAATPPAAVLADRYWRDVPPTGGRIVVAREQGIGDEIQFASVYPDLLKLGVPVAIQCASRLQPAFARSFPGVTFMSCEEHPEAWRELLPGLQPGDLVTFAGDLLPRFRRSRTDFGPAKAFLRPDPTAVARWRDRLAQRGDALRIGISWRGGTTPNFAAQRSIALAELLAAIPAGSLLVDLQYTDCGEEIAATPRAESLERFPEIREDFDALINLVAALDLVITVQTAVAHVAGALGVNTWVLVPQAPTTVRWLARDGRTPWYSSVQLLGQQLAGDWRPVLATVRRKLVAMSARRKRNRNVNDEST